MTPEQLADIRDRAAAATPGPWHRGHFRRHAIFPEGPKETAWSVAEVRPNIYGDWPNAEMEPQDEGNVHFIAHARTDIPDLLAEVDRLRALLAQQTDDGR